jgi:glycosyltransferase involved in cell wall biosynthesis
VRILQVITLYRPDFVGGATLVCERLAGGLRARGHTVAILCGRPDADAEPYGTTTWQIDGIPVTGVHVASGYVALDRRGYRHPEVAPVLTRLLDDFRPDVVHVHSIQALGAGVLATAAARGIPVVLTMHDWWWYCVRLFLVDPAGFVCPPRVDPARCHCAPEIDLVARRAFLDEMAAHAAAVLAPSRFLADAIVANGMPDARVAVCPNGVDRPAVPPPSRRPGPVRFAYFGGPDNRLKGLPAVLDALPHVDAGGWEMALYGVDRATPIPTVVADRVRRLAPFAPETVSTVLAGCDVLIVPSLMRESFSLVVREALIAGRPVVASDSGGPQEIVRHGRNGLVFATGHGGDLATCMRRLILEPELHDRLAAGARATPIPTLADQLDQTEAVYARVRDRRPPAAAATAPHPRHVAFICGIDGAPLRYRVTNLRDQLDLHHITSEACYWTDPEVPAAIERSDLVVVYRVPMGPWVRACLDHARALDRPLVFSCDDLVFERTRAPLPALAALPDDQRRAWLAFADRYAETLRACDGFLGSTDDLVAAAGRAGRPGQVVPNGLGHAQLAAAERAYKAAGRAAADGTVRIAYLSGTIMHDHDFAVVAPALAAVLAAHPAVRLRIVGYLHLDAILAPFTDRIERLPFLPWPEVFTALADVDVNLAPLAPLGAFSDAKSAVKYLEAALMGVPTIASPTPPLRAAIRDGDNGVLADTTEWASVLDALVTDPARRRRLGNAARADAFLHYGPATQADRLLRALAAMPTPPRTAPAAPAPRPTPIAGETGRCDLEPADALPGSAEVGRDRPSPFLHPGRTVGQRFEARADGLYRIDVCAGTDGRRPRHHLIVGLADGPDTTATRHRTVTLDAAMLVDGGWIAATFAPIADSAGRTFYVWVESTDAAPDDAVTLWTYVTGWGERAPSGLHLDHVPAPGSLTFRTFHRPVVDAPLTPRAGSPSP